MREKTYVNDVCRAYADGRYWGFTVLRYDLKLLNLTKLCKFQVTQDLFFKVDLHGDMHIIEDGNCYEATSIVFHWGSADDRGSEHLLDQKAFPMEVSTSSGALSSMRSFNILPHKFSPPPPLTIKHYHKNPKPYHDCSLISITSFF